MLILSLVCLWISCPRSVCVLLPLSQELADLRALLTLPCPDDLLAYRFLRGHKFDLPVAAKHLQHTLDMRKEVGLDALRVKAEKIEQKQFPFADKVLAVHPHTSVEQRAEKHRTCAVWAILGRTFV